MLQLHYAMASSSSVGNASSADAICAQAFYTHFRAATESLLTQLSTSATSPELLQHALQTYAELSAQFTRAVDSGVLPSHDQRVHKDRLQDISAAMQDKSRALTEQQHHGQKQSKTRGSFAFKRKQPAATSASMPTSTPLSTWKDATANVESLTAEAQLDAAQRRSNHLTISALHETKYTHPAPNPTQAEPPTSVSVDLTNISNSIVDLRPLATTHTIVALQIRNVTCSAIALPPIEGSIMIHTLSNSMLSIPSCHQFRMHLSTNAVVALSTKRASVVTIEGCKRITFVTHNHEPIKVQDFDDLINSEQLKQAGSTDMHANFNVVQHHGPEWLTSRINALITKHQELTTSGFRHDFERCMQLGQQELETDWNA